jgi:hypothetical protein
MAVVPGWLLVSPATVARLRAARLLPAIVEGGTPDANGFQGPPTKFT